MYFCFPRVTMRKMVSQGLFVGVECTGGESIIFYGTVDEPMMAVFLYGTWIECKKEDK